MAEPLQRLSEGMPIVFGGDRFVRVDAALARSFAAGDRLIVTAEAGDLLHIPAATGRLVRAAVDQALTALAPLAAAKDATISGFFDDFARRLQDDGAWSEVARANARDLAAARGRGRPVGRLALSAPMRADMIAGLRAWRDLPDPRGRVVETLDHQGFTVEQITAPLGVVGFVFEGRPNVAVDAAGVLRGGNAAVMRIGSDALETARALFEHAVRPALEAAALPTGALTLIDSPERSAGWALFDDARLALAVARGSGPAVRQLGALARQTGIPVSLHGTGGAWLVADESADADRFAAAVRNSLDRKVCNTLNVCLIVRARAAELVPVFVGALEEAGLGRGGTLHLDPADAAWIPSGRRYEPMQTAGLGREWEWDETPEVALKIVAGLDEAIGLFNAHAPRLAASLIAQDPAAQERFWSAVEAPFVGDGFTRWVDGLYALGRPELGLSNWQAGRLLGRGAVLTGEGVFTLRTRMRQHDPHLRR